MATNNQEKSQDNESKEEHQQQKVCSSKDGNVNKSDDDDDFYNSEHSEYESSDSDNESPVDKHGSHACALSSNTFNKKFVSEDPRECIAERYYCLSMDELRVYEQFLTQLIFSTLKRVGVCVLKDFLPTSLAELVRNEIEELYNAADTKTARTDFNYRTDEVAWIGANDVKNESIQKLSHTFQRLIVAISRSNRLFKVTHKSHSQVSKFPKSSVLGYKPHIENPNNNGRLLSVGYFTNKDYSRVPDEGQVRFYLNNNTKYVEVEPDFNTAVIYWSDRRVIKEVLPSNSKDLYHVTSWFFGSCSLP